jgi:hypothetical protein
MADKELSETGILGTDVSVVVTARPEVKEGTAGTAASAGMVEPAEQLSLTSKEDSPRQERPDWI